MTELEPGRKRTKKRTAEEIRNSLDSTREQVDEDLTALGDRFQASVDPIRQVRRHPVLLVLTGAVVGFMVVKRPALLMRVVGGIAKWGAPLLVSSLLRQASPREEIAPPEAAPPETPPEN